MKVVLFVCSIVVIFVIVDEFGDGVIVILCDVLSFESFVFVVEVVKVDFGFIDVFIGNVGMIELMMLFVEIDLVVWGYIIDVNLKGVYYGMWVVLLDMVVCG